MAYTTIKKPSDYFNTKLYTGDGNDGRAVTGVGFQPDFCWFKSRSAAGNYHDVYDAIRGATKRIYPNDTSAEQTVSAGLQSFTSDGFTLGTNSDVNQNSVTYASWNWLADNTSGSSNTDGSITSNVSANTTSGFSIVSYTGTEANATVGHGLGVAPKMIIVKRLNGTTDWVVGHQEADTSNPWNKYLQLNDPTTPLDRAVFNDTAPTNSVFSVGADILTNASAAPMIAYCFAEKKGFSKFGSYVSNNNANGTFVYTGFKPAFLLLKNVTSGNTSWELYDNKRTPNNVANLFLRANTTDADVSSDRLDMLSNGFKLRQVGDTNYNSDVIIYMAFAEEPLVGDNPATAR